MFNDKKNDAATIVKLNNRIKELENELNEVANDNGSIIIKQLPNGEIELNGVAIDKDAPVEYYNSAKATYGELTMFRIGKESKQREMDKLIQRHMEEIDEYNSKIVNLEQDVRNYKASSELDKDTIQMLEKSETKLKDEISRLNNQNETDKELANLHLQEVVNRYEGMIEALEEDVKTWKERYLKINNVTLDGTIITKYGKVLSNNK